MKRLKNRKWKDPRGGGVGLGPGCVRIVQVNSLAGAERGEEVGLLRDGDIERARSHGVFRPQ